MFLRASPIDVSAIVRDAADRPDAHDDADVGDADRRRRASTTSATRLGIGDADEMRLALGVRLPRGRRFSTCRSGCRIRGTIRFAVAAGREVIEILKRTRGRAFVLFTSYATMRAVQAIAEMALDYPILAQGSAPRSQLLDQFRQTPHSVLFATSSFWQGVDVVGEALSCVIIDKLPFASPGDPITAARIDAIRARGGDPFGEYQVAAGDPRAAAGAGPAHPPPARPRRPGGAGSAPRGPRDTAGGSSPRCRPRRSFTISRESTRVFSA